MTDQTPASGLSPEVVPPPVFTSLRQARLDRGLTLEGLASMIKVTPAKLDALESGRYQDLPDAAFTRALAMAVCRVLRIDPAPVLAGLPVAQPISLAANAPKQVPFDASRTRLKLNLDEASPGIGWSAILAPRYLAPIAVLLAAVLLYFFPSDVDWSAWLPSHKASPVAADSAHADAVALGASQMVAEEVVPANAVVAAAASMPDVQASAPDAVVPPAASGEASAPIAAAEAASMPVLTVERSRQPGSMSSGSALVMVSFADSWVEVRNGKGEKLLSRTVSSGETVGIDGEPPLYVKIGNASGMQVSYMGRAIELDGFTRNNVARLELK